MQGVQKLKERGVYGNTSSDEVCSATKQRCVFQQPVSCIDGQPGFWRVSTIHGPWSSGGLAEFFSRGVYSRHLLPFFTFSVSIHNKREQCTPCKDL